MESLLTLYARIDAVASDILSDKQQVWVSVNLNKLFIVKEVLIVGHYLIWSSGYKCLMLLGNR